MRTYQTGCSQQLDQQVRLFPSPLLSPMVSYLCAYDLYVSARNAFDAGSIHYEGKRQGALALAFQLDAISQGLKNLDFQGPTPSHLPKQWMLPTSKALHTGHINHIVAQVALCTRAHGRFQGPYLPPPPVPLSNITALFPPSPPPPPRTYQKST